MDRGYKTSRIDQVPLIFFTQEVILCLAFSYITRFFALLYFSLGLLIATVFVFVLINAFYLSLPVYIFTLLRQCMYILFSLFLKKPSIFSFQSLSTLPFTLAKLNKRCYDCIICACNKQISQQDCRHNIDLHDIDRGYESIVFIAMNDSYSRNLQRPCPPPISVMILVLLLRWFTVHKDCPSVGFC